MTDPVGEASDVSDFKDVLSHPVGGELPLLVGGHAVNIWATVYQERLFKELQEWQPLTSKDLDLFGDVALLEEMKHHFGGQYRLSGPRSPVVGQLTVDLNGHERKIDVLRNVVGLTQKEIFAGPLTLNLCWEGQFYLVRVLPSITLLQAKIANLATLDQAGRNDFQHVKIMLLVNREALADVIGKVESGQLEGRAAIVPLGSIRKLISSPQATFCSTCHGIDWSQIWPRKSLETATDPKIQNFVKHWLS